MFLWSGIKILNVFVIRDQNLGQKYRISYEKIYLVTTLLLTKRGVIEQSIHFIWLFAYEACRVKNNFKTSGTTLILHDSSTMSVSQKIARAQTGDAPLTK